MKKNINLLLASILVITLISVFSISLVSAEIPTASNITVNLPSATRLSGNQAFNISFDAGFEDQNWTKISAVYLISTSSTANTTVASGTMTFTGSANETDLEFNGTIATTSVEDGTDYTLTFALTNGTSNLNKTATSKTIDNTIPTTPTLSPTTETRDTDGTVNFTGTVGGENTTSCTLYFDGRNPGSTSYTMDHISDTCSYTLSNIPEQTYNWYIGNSDGTNTTNSATNTVHVDTSNKNVGIVTTDVDEQGFALEGDEDVSNWIIPIIVILVVLGVGYFIAKRK